ncbi:glycosyltransferase family 8 protein [Campylobacter insulaenigrae]|uniref:glycosyltransferase family 8 protein n=1 Tax=Campylobacter insulaenigrae TaxID=260714 RepID=UPI00215220C4|nr:glycosyltransferase family 8 protein [Campylobacter insulaenigrae]MCR6580934.1 glycosyltransferase family 8 protein [Campylobacter insulaenigrae]
MYHIVLNVSNEYMKYASVLISSIVFNTQDNKNYTKDPYCFHIISSELTIYNIKKIREMEHQLNEIYPIKIFLHKADEKDFKELPSWAGSKATYFILLFEKFIPIDDISKCLIMDVDMLVLGDIRELFSYNLQDYFLGVVLDYSYHKESSILEPRKSLKMGKDFYFEYPEKYFNGGLLLINVNKWRAHNITNKMYDFFGKYRARVAMQDALNAVSEGNILILPMSWNFFPNNFFIDKTFKNTSKLYNFNYSESEYYDAQNDIKIIHFAYDTIKPWGRTEFARVDATGKPIVYPYYKEWWEIAFNVPVFSHDLKEVKHTLHYKGLVDLSFCVFNTMKNFSDNLVDVKNNNFIKSGAVDIIKNHLSYKIGNYANQQKTFFSKVTLPFGCLFIYLKHKLIDKKIKNFSNLNEYSDYTDASRIKESCEYKLGNSILKSNLFCKIKLMYKGMENG